MNIDLILNKAIKANGYTKEEFAKKLGYSRQNLDKHIKNLKKNKLTFTGDSIIKIKKLLSIDLIIFFWFSSSQLWILLIFT